MGKTFKIIGIVFGYMVCVIFLLIILVNGYFAFSKLALKKDYPTIFGYSQAVIVSGSMSPTINKNDYIIIKKKNNYVVGDIISYKDDIGTVTHRIVEVTENGYITWGDNREINNTPDAEVAKGDVYGKVVLTIPKIGVVIQFLKSIEGIISLSIFLVVLLISIRLISSIRKNKQK